MWKEKEEGRDGGSGERRKEGKEEKNKGKEMKEKYERKK